MGRYLGRKLSFYLVTFVVAVTVDWAIPRFMPGDTSVWRNYLQMTGMDMLTHLQAAR